jgi:transposase InsO family protein
MPWRETGAVDERDGFVEEVLAGVFSKAAVCRRYGVSRVTGDKWLERYRAEGRAGLGDRSRAPHHHPNAVPVATAEAVVALRERYPHWGPKKLRAFLMRADPRLAGVWPAASTIGDLLKGRGLAGLRRRRHHTPAYTEPFASCDGPNAVWCVDFKGWFRTGDGRRCEPLTLSDAWSRYLLRCQAMGSTRLLGVWGVLEAAFRQYGLPAAIRSDNGVPFANVGLGGLSRLSVWWIRLGIAPERIELGHPEQNGRHERLHRTLGEATARPPRPTQRLQQRAFDAFRREYNEERPHEALGMRTPAEVYAPSPRAFPARLPELEYPSSWTTRSVEGRGSFRWERHRVFASKALAGERVGLEPLSERFWTVWFGPVALGLLDAATGRIVRQDRACRYLREHLA